MRLLEEPELLEGDDRVSSGDLEVEDLLQLLETQDVRLLRMRPAQQRGEVDERGREDALLVAEEGDVDVRIAFAQLLPALLDKEWDVAESGRGPVEGVV